ncbi:nitroreductase family protein [Burkholderia sp. WAC0059]|uniref:nitroreductase family protein n=1 Tax=Burkholderia sp. WAC0059 TaxID=2066022 RepID=UPI000C7E957E|nr:nitroreductase family protein [Burkholderia sp. WAC0059]PLZ03517.1 nitroreductase family protein [Burkholderia sp. WAC0059]
MTTSNGRTADHPIDRQFLDRWSPRAFADTPITDEALRTFLEAARWAPSSYNSQPWRFVYARRDTGHWTQFLGFLNEFNQGWARTAAAIVIVLSKTTFVPPGGKDEVPARHHSFDTGAAWGYFALQASLAGWKTHGLAGIEHERIRRELAIPEAYAIEAGIAIGRLGDRASLPEALQAREQPSPRQPISAFSAEGRFAFDV